jgi:hypothetical protein
MVDSDLIQNSSAFCSFTPNVPNFIQVCQAFLIYHQEKVWQQNDQSVSQSTKLTLIHPQTWFVE